MTDNNAKPLTEFSVSEKAEYEADFIRFVNMRNKFVRFCVFMAFAIFIVKLSLGLFELNFIKIALATLAIVVFGLLTWVGIYKLPIVFAKRSFENDLKNGNVESFSFLEDKLLVADSHSTTSVSYSELWGAFEVKKYFFIMQTQTSGWIVPKCEISLEINNSLRLTLTEKLSRKFVILAKS